MPRSFFLAVGVFLAGCTSQVLGGYVGKSITEVQLQKGPPMNLIELEDGRRAYQWARNESGVIPMTTPTTATVYTSGGVGWVSGTTTNYIPYSTNCVDTVFAAQQGKEWIVVGFQPPTLECE